MNRYNNGKIYSIRSHQTDDVYIGSTCMPLSKRLYGHKSNYKVWFVGKHGYCTAYEVIKYDDCYIELIEGYPCENKQQLLQREGELIRSLPCVNKRIAGNTMCCEDHTAYCKKYYKQNKESILSKRKEHYEQNKEHICFMKHQQYEKNKADILSTVTCEICKCEITKGGLARHNQTKKHLHNLQG